MQIIPFWCLRIFADVVNVWLQTLQENLFASSDFPTSPSDGGVFVEVSTIPVSYLIRTQVTEAYLLL